MRKGVAIALLITAIVAAGLAIWRMRHAFEFRSAMPQTTPTAASENASTAPVHNPSDTIEVTAPAPNALIQAPVAIAGRAKNLWYSEGRFPVELVDFAGTVLAKAPAQAQGDSAGSGFIPFSFTVSFSAPTTTTGLLILRNDNRSGDPQKDSIFAIPVRFRR